MEKQEDSRDIEYLQEVASSKRLLVTEAVERHVKAYAW
jgi:hypothetical protein